jgi:hypothetical protein
MIATLVAALALAMPTSPCADAGQVCYTPSRAPIHFTPGPAPTRAPVHFTPSVRRWFRAV